MSIYDPGSKTILAPIETVRKQVIRLGDIFTFVDIKFLKGSTKIALQSLKGPRSLSTFNNVSLKIRATNKDHRLVRTPPAKEDSRIANSVVRFVGVPPMIH